MGAVAPCESALDNCSRLIDAARRLDESDRLLELLRAQPAGTGRDLAIRLVVGPLSAGSA